MRYPVTPDGRYFVVRGRLWRTTNPNLDDKMKVELTSQLMAARRAVRNAKGDPEAVRLARVRVDNAKIELGERGPVWWNDGAPDLNRHMAKNTPYVDWFASINEPTG